MKASAFYTLPASQTGVDLPLKFPNGQPSGITLKVLGTDSGQFQKAASIKNKERPRIKYTAGQPDVTTGPIILSMPWTAQEDGANNTHVRIWKSPAAGQWS